MANISATCDALAKCTSSDPIKLHMRAVNGLSICQRELRQQVPCYSLARMYLEMAQQAIAALEAIETAV